MSWFSSFISIGGNQLPSPRSYRVQRSDLDTENTTRDESGVLHRDRIRTGVYKIYATWRLTSSQLSSVVSAIEPASFSVTFYDPNTNATVTRSMYSGDRSSEMVVGADAAANTLWDFTVNLIEL